MFRFLMILLLIAAAIAGFGYYRGWFQVESEKSAGGNSRITITTDNEKIKKDKETMMEHLPGGGEPAKGTTPANSGKTP